MRIIFRTVLVTIALLFQLFIFRAVGIVAAFDEVDATTYFWKLINEARARPQALINAYGMDRTKAEAALGSDSWILELEDGLPPLAWHDLLAQSATAHNQDMIDRHYYSYITLDRRTESGDAWGVHDRMMAEGYDPLFSGETLGIVNLYLYQDPMAAVEGLFENMVRDELNPSMDYPKNILGKTYTEIGIAFQSTQFTLLVDGEDQTFNAYVVTLDFAKPVEKRSHVLGHLYQDGIGSVSVAQDDLAGRLFLYNGWAPENAINDVRVVVNNISQQWMGEAVYFPLGGYQVEIPMETYYSMFFLRGADNTTMKRVIDYGRNENVQLDVLVE